GDGIRDRIVTGVQTCALPILALDIIQMEGHPLPEENETENWEKHDEMIQRFIQVIAKNMNLYGITPSVGRLYGVLYFNDQPMTRSEERRVGKECRCRRGRYHR